MAAEIVTSRYDIPWLILSLGEKLYALEIETVREMVQMVALSPVPHAPGYIRGVTNRRDRSLTVLDLRKRLGLPGLDQETEELVALLRQRQQEHVHWLEELESCVEEGREFTLGRDPTQCAFGRWHGTFHTDNLTLQAHLKRFTRPHQEIHAVADQAMAMVKAGRREHALALISDVRGTTLALMRRLFDGGIQLLQESNTETLVILENGDQLLGLATDLVDSVEYLEPGSINDIGIPDVSWNPEEQLVRSTAKTARTGRLVLVLEIAALCSTLGAVAVAG